MTMRRYPYLGPPELRDLPRSPGTAALESAAALGRWLAAQHPIDRQEPFTYVVRVDGVLWLAPRRSEHVACARGEEVLAAGEMRFTDSRGTDSGSTGSARTGSGSTDSGSTDSGSAGSGGTGSGGTALWTVAEVSNQSTGYCPDIGSWQAVQAALDRVGVQHPGGFTMPIEFRRCAACSNINIVREQDFVCAVCDHKLPQEWNLG